jgi:APA family basic amino acid/polyamine antiporter
MITNRSDTSMTMRAASAIEVSSVPEPREFVRALSLFDGTMFVIGSMIGSGVFIVGAEITRETGSAGGLLLTFLITGLLTVAAAVCYGELAGLFPDAGGQYVYLREAYSPFWGFLYGWTLFLVIQTGTIAAVAIGFSRYLGALFPVVSPTTWIVQPIALSSTYAVSLSLQQLVAAAMIVVLTIINTQGVRLGKLIQNAFSIVKVATLVGMILAGIFIGGNAAAISDNFRHLWNIRGAQPIAPGAGFLHAFVPAVTAAAGGFGLLVALGVAQTGSLFTADAWNNIGFAAGEMRNPKRDVPRAMIIGTIVTIMLFCLVNVAYLFTLPLAQIQAAPDDRVASAVFRAIWGPAGSSVVALGIVVATLGCNNGMLLSGARVYYAMARDGLFFRAVGTLNDKGVPAVALVLQGAWTVALVMIRTRTISPSGTVVFGNIYSDLLNYVVFAVLMFYVLTIAGIFVLRRTSPLAERPFLVVGYPFTPLIYVAATLLIMGILLFYKTETTWPGLVIVSLGIPVYWLWRISSRAF